MKFYLVFFLIFSTYMNVAVLAAEDTSIGSSVVTYDQNYFDSFNPVTLLDMLMAVPGVPDILNKNQQQARRAAFSGGGGQRGFGSGGDQILMDGKRLAGKANNINDTLSRVSATQVNRVELIRGAASGLDVQSQGLVINIIMKEGGSTSTTFWKIKGEYTENYDFVPEFLLSHNGSLGKLDYTLSYERQNNDFFFNGKEKFYGPTNLLISQQTLTGNFDRFGHKLNTNIEYEFKDGSRLRLNGLYEPNGMNGKEYRDKTSDSLRPIFWDTDRDDKKWEVGGDYTKNLGFLGSLKSLFVINQSNLDQIVFRFKGEGINKYEYTRDITDEDRSEGIFRSSLTRKLTSEQSIEFGGEAAINKFDKVFKNYDRTNITSNLFLDSSDNVKIKENRYEVFANHSYNISPSMTLQSSLTSEFSKIVADNLFLGGEVDRRNTSFTYLKPRVNFRYDLSSQDQVRILLEKKVSQLNFNNFVTRFDPQELLYRVGNTKIRPEQTWDFAVTFEHRLLNDKGSFEGELFYRKYTDHISSTDFTNYVDDSFNPIGVDSFFALPPSKALRDYVDDTGNSYSAKSGNIPTAKGYGVKLKSNLRLAFIGFPDATLSINYIYERRRTKDQFTGLMRNFDRHSDHRVDINFRHDISTYKITYGFDFSARSDSSRHYISYYWPDSPAANIKIFAEKTIFSKYKLRFEAEGLTRNRGSSKYYIYNDHIRFSDLKERQDKFNRRPIELRVSIQGTF
ncbi:MAG: outer membrane beta-barrel protein [Kordiimonadaceae bacterium]|nr:outer membrane beta-barrel protein [Kordiimonadaceae bacterium]